MGTSAWIVREFEESYEGVHVNSDGYCDHVGSVITGLVGRLGLADAVAALFSQDAWSGLDLGQRLTGSDRYIEVEGVGEAYPLEDTRPHVHSEGVEWFAADEGWVYVFGEEGGVSVFKSRGQVAHVFAHDLGSFDWVALFDRLNG